MNNNVYCSTSAQCCQTQRVLCSAILNVSSEWRSYFWGS